MLVNLVLKRNMNLNNSKGLQDFDIPIKTIYPIQDGLFRGCSRMGEAFLPPLPKIRHTYPTVMKLGTVITYLRNIQKMYKSRDTFIDFC